jgi:hypothetical protein
LDKFGKAMAALKKRLANPAMEHATMLMFGAHKSKMVKDAVVSAEEGAPGVSLQ